MKFKLRHLIPSKRREDERARTLTRESNALANAQKAGKKRTAKQIRKQMHLDD